VDLGVGLVGVCLEVVFVDGFLWVVGVGVVCELGEAVFVGEEGGAGYVAREGGGFGTVGAGEVEWGVFVVGGVGAFG